MDESRPGADVTTMLVRYNYLYFAGKWFIEHKMFASMVFHCKKLSNFNTILAFGQDLSEILPLILILQFLHNGACQSVSLGVGKEIIFQDLTHFVLIAGEYQLSVDT